MALDIICRGESGQSYTLKTFPLGTQFNAVSGVYVFCRRVDSENWEALYVGETRSFEQILNTGIGSHDGYLRSIRLGMTHIAAIAVGGDVERLRIETDLRHSLNPPANTQGGHCQ